MSQTSHVYQINYSFWVNQTFFYKKTKFFALLECELVTRIILLGDVCDVSAGTNDIKKLNENQIRYFGFGFRLG